MLQSLLVKNYALIDHLEIDLSEKLTILTGETGAGKSIILGALGLILGRRADTSVLFRQDKKCVVEGRFWIKPHDLKSFFEAHDLDYEDLTHIRREINKSGKSRAFINDTPVNLTILRSLTSHLVDLHQQHETIELMSDDFQLKVIDSLANHEALLQDFKQQYRQYQALQKEIRELKEKDQQAQQDLDYYEFQLNELQEANLQNDEEKTAMEEELEKLNNAEAIKSHLYNAYQGLSQADVSSIGLLQEVAHELQAIAAFHENYEKLKERLESVRIEVEDAAREIEQEQEDVVYDEARIQELTDRLNLIYKLEKKHGVQSVDELASIRDRLDEQVQQISGLDDKIKEKEQALDQIFEKLSKTGKKITTNRQQAKQSFEKEANALLPEVGMPNGQLSVAFEKLENPANNGFDEITFYFSANKGHNKLPLGKVASGGELSRVMLIIKSLVAASTALPTLIFDEIDTGISGETARKVGGILKDLSNNHQVIAITHLPQIAGKANIHYFVYKESIKGQTYTRIKSLNTEERTQEIAKMISGDQPTTAAIENARELLAD